MSHFNLSYQQLDLKLHQPFTISRNSKSVVPNVLVELSDDEFTGLGEAGPNVRYDEDVEKVIQYLSTIPFDFFDDIKSENQFAQKLKRHNESLPSSIRSVKSAQAALETAWLDWWGKHKNQPLWKLWDAPAATGPVTSYTIGLDEIDVMQQKVQDAAEFPIYKVKLGTNRDRKIIKALREVTDKLIRVDANEGWKTLDQAKEMITFLADHNIELIEQPMPAEQLNNLQKLKEFSPLPLCADESFTGEESLGEIAKAFDIINIKLMKTGSLMKAKNVIEQARKYNLQVMIGCMIESSIANTAGALLSLWADFADLDGHLLINNDPAEGLKLNDSKHIILNNDPGLGVYLK